MRCRVISPVLVQLERPLIQPIDDPEMWLFSKTQFRRVLKDARELAFMVGCLAGAWGGALVTWIFQEIQHR